VIKDGYLEVMVLPPLVLELQNGPPRYSQLPSQSIAVPFTLYAYRMRPPNARSR
jgi:hypothetical protein